MIAVLFSPTDSIARQAATWTALKSPTVAKCENRRLGIRAIAISMISEMNAGFFSH
jgi:hypothetical protein